MAKSTPHPRIAFGGAQRPHPTVEKREEFFVIKPMRQDFYTQLLYHF